MEMSKIEYIRKNGRRSGGGKKKGVLFCGIDPDDANSVMVGFSLCNSVDRFDYIKNKPVPGFGMETAKLRAEKWKLYIDYFVQKSYTESELNGDMIWYVNPNPQEVIEIPPSIVWRMKIFVQRCRRYYKDKDFPEWVEKLERGESYPMVLLEHELYIDVDDEIMFTKEREFSNEK